MSITHILVPTDFSDAAARALEYGSRLAVTLRAELTVLHIVSPPTTHSCMEGADQSGATTEAWLTDANATLAEAIASVRDHVPVVRGMVVIGLEAEEILDFTSVERVDLIVIGMHGHGRTARLIHGSVTDRVLRRAPCPVLAIPACAGEATCPKPTAALRCSKRSPAAAPGGWHRSQTARGVEISPKGEKKSAARPLFPTAGTTLGNESHARALA